MWVARGWPAHYFFLNVLPFSLAQFQFQIDLEFHLTNFVVAALRIKASGTATVCYRGIEVVIKQIPVALCAETIIRRKVVLPHSSLLRLASKNVLSCSMPIN